VPRWLADRVGGQGRVLATDIDVSWARQAAVPTRDSIAVSITRVRDGLQKAGWRIVEFNSWTDSKAPTLKAEAPEKGYGATLEGVTTDPGKPKIGFNFSSPCFHHPDEEKS
jgi:hypothetical protein